MCRAEDAVLEHERDLAPVAHRHRERRPRVVLDADLSLRQQDSVEEQADRLREASRRVLEGSLRGDPARPGVDAPRPHATAESDAAEHDGHEDQKPDGERCVRGSPSDTGLDGDDRHRCGSAGRDQCRCNPGQSHHDRACPEPQRDTRGRQPDECDACRPSGVLRLGCGGAAGQTQERQAGRLHERRDGERRGERKRADRHDGHHPRERRQQACASGPEQSLEDQPLAGEPVERWEPADRGSADPEAECRERHHPGQTAEPIEITQPGRPEHRPGAQEQEALEDSVIERVEEGRREGHRRERRLSVRRKKHRRSEPEEDDPDVLDAAEREQALEIVLHDRVQDAQHGRTGSRDEDRHGPPVGSAT